MNWIAALGVLFVALKLTEVITWSWWLVLLPFYGGFVIAFLFVFAVFMGAISTKKL